MRYVTQCLRTVMSIFALICFLTPALTLADQGTGRVEVRFEETNPASFPIITTRVTVLDPNGIPIPGLDASNFHAFEDGQTVAVGEVQPTSNPNVRIAVALAIDMSGTMYEEFDEAKASAVSFVNQLGPDDLVAVIGFKDKVNLEEPFPQIDPTREIAFTADKGAVVNLINSVTVPDPNLGDTPLYDALFKAVRMTARATGVDYRFVIAFTDGKQDCRKRPQDCIVSPDHPITEARDGGVPVFTVGLGDQADETYLKQVALMTGSAYNYAPTPDKLAAIYQAAADQMRQQYLIAYQAKAAADGKPHRLELKVTTPRGEGSNVNAVPYPCPAKPGIRLFYMRSSTAGLEPTQEALTDGQEAAGLFTIVPDINACNPIAKVDLLIDGQYNMTSDIPPFHVVVDLLSLQQTAPGPHLFTLRATDTAGVAGDDVAVSVNVLPLLPTAIATSGQGTPQATPLPTSPGTTTRSGIPPAALAAGGIALAGILAAVLLAARRPARRCPNCGRKMDPSWSECLFCADRSATQTGMPMAAGLGDQTDHELPIVGYGAQDISAPEAPAITAAPAAMPDYGGPAQAGPPIQQPAPATEVFRRLPRRMGWLVVVEGERAGTEYRLQEGDTNIGRAGSNEIIFSEASVGRQQAKVRLQADGFYLYDLATTNPTLVNGQPVTRHRLSSGDRVQFGTTALVFKEVETH